MAEPLGERLIGDLPQLGPDDPVVFACHPGVACFNACCADLDLLLSPYDTWRLRRALGLSGAELVARHTRREREPGTGFPLVYLKMSADPGQPCPFVRREGCSVYADRPSACRAYPLGRGTRLDADGRVLETFVVVHEPHCRGFAETQRWTPRTYMAAQGLEPYNQANDQFMRLLAAWQDSGRRLADREADLVHAALYAPETLAEQLAAGGELLTAEWLGALSTDSDEAHAAALRWVRERFAL